MTMWMVRADRGSRLYQSFIEKSVVAIGVGQVGNLAEFPTREKILERVGEVWPEWKQQARIVIAGVLFRFSKVLEIGDWVITYDQTRRVYSTGLTDGPCTYEPNFDPDARNVRAVRWDHGEFSRDELSTSTRNTLGSTLGLFLLPAEAEADVRRVIGQSSDSDISLDPESATESEENLLHGVEARSVEFIKDRIVRLGWEDMQELVAGLLRAMGYKTRVSPAGPDRGKDIVASPDGFGFEDPRIVVEVKHRPSSTMGSPEIRSLSEADIRATRDCT